MSHLDSQNFIQTIADLTTIYFSIDVNAAGYRMVWLRDLAREGKSAAQNVLIEWMSEEMKSRMRATVPVGWTSQRHVNHLKAEGEMETRQNNPKCWLCKNSTHWPDQCPKFAALGIEQLKMAKENHVHFSCVRRHGRDHRAANCTQRQQCTIAENEAWCSQYHYTPPP